jgi:hypothetical protein
MTTLEKHRHRYESLAALYESRANEAEAAGDHVSADTYRRDAVHSRGQAFRMACESALASRDQPESD